MCVEMLDISVERKERGGRVVREVLCCGCR